MGKTIAERLRECEAGNGWICWGSFLAEIIEDGECSCPEDTGGRLACRVCYESQLRKLADAIEAEQRAAVAKALLEEVGKPDSVSVGLLVDVAGELEDAASMLEGAMSEDLSHWAVLIRKAVKRPEPEVLDADGVPIKVGEILYDMEGYELKVTGLVDGLVAYESDWNCKVSGNMLTHRKPDTQEAIDSDAELFAVTLDADEEERFRSLLERQRKLLGGE